ncbi:MAG: peptidoglycan-binding domain-containing protein [Clostridia bacterium]|nr:peptidoglycan-binding domain-containing protein [Clostridia bacterium]
MKRTVLLLLVLSLILSASFASASEQDALLAQGSSGDQVVRLQLRLFDLGFYTYKPTGSFQVVTRTAVIAFQQRAGIMSDGSVGSESLSLLYSNSAPRAAFASVIPISYTAQSSSLPYKGSGMDWYEVRAELEPNLAYQVTNAESGETAGLFFLNGAYHAEMQPVSNADRLILNGWLGSTNSYYKCAVTLNLNGREIAASIQWNGENICMYFTNSRSHVAGLTDVEHSALVALATR